MTANQDVPQRKRLHARCLPAAMRLTPAAAAVPVLLVLLTWLSFRAIDPDASDSGQDEAIAINERNA